MKPQKMYSFIGHRVICQILLLCLAFTLVSCYEKESECLDELSTNFTISADEACDDCCTYPNVKLQVLHFLGEAKYSSDSIITNDFDQELKLDQLVLFLSDFEFHTTENQTLEVNETSVFENEASEEFDLKDDAIVISQNTQISTIGMVREIGVIDSVECQVGVYHNLLPLEATSSLYNYDSLYVNNRFYDLVMYLKIGDSLKDDILLRFSSINSNFFVQDTVIDIVKQARTDISLKVSIDYLEILQSIELDASQSSMEFDDFIIPKEFINFIK